MPGQGRWRSISRVRWANGSRSRARNFWGFETTMEVKKMHVLRKAILAAACTAGLAAATTPALAQTTLRAVMHSDLKILDPIWTTAYIVRNHGYMIYDTLLAQDEKGAVQPQMVEKYETAADNKSYTFTLRDGLLWHDGQAGDVGRLHRLDQALGSQRLSRSEDDDLRQLDRRRSTPRPSPSSSRNRPVSCCSACQNPRPTCRS